MSIKSVIQSAVSWLVDKVLRPVVQWITEAIQNLIAEVRYWKHKAMELLAKWLDNDWFFLVAVAVTIGLAVTWPKIVAAITKMAIAVWLKNIWKQAKAGLLKIVNLLNWINLDLINTMLKIAWPEWQKMMAQLADVTAALAEELGQGSGFILSYFSVVHGLAHVKNAFLGADPKLAELDAFQATSDQLQRINDRFRKYAHDPGAIVQDIIEEIYIPFSETIRDAQQTTIDGIRDNYEKLLDQERSVRGLEESLSSFRAGLPDELEEFASERLDPFIDKLDGALDIIETEVLPKLDGVIAAMELASERQAKINDRVFAKLDEPLQILSGYYTAGPDSQEEMRSLMYELTRGGMDDETEMEMPAVLDQIWEASQSAQVAATRIGVFETLGYEPPGVKPAASSPAQRNRDWYVGDW